MPEVQTNAFSAWNPMEKALALALFAVAIGLIGIRRPIFIDEANSIIIAGYNLRGVLDHLKIDNNLPLYYVFLHFWIRIFGISEIATRVPSIVFYWLGILAAYALGVQVSRNSRVALYCAFFYAASLQAIHLAQKVRMYSLLGLLACVSTWLLFGCFWEGESRWQDWALYVLANIAGSFTHLWFLFLLFAQFLCFLVFFPRAGLRRFFACLAFSTIPFVVLWSGTLLQQMKNGATDWMPPEDVLTAPFALLEFYGGVKIGSVFLLACGLLLLIKKRAAGPTTRPDDRRAQWALFILFVVSVGVPLIVSAFKSIYWPGRYTIIALPALSVVLAWKLAETVWRPALAAFAGVVLVTILGLHIAARDDMIENSWVVIHSADSDRTAAQELLHRVQPGDVLLFTGLSRASVQYYFRRYGREGDFVWNSFPAENADHLGWDNQRPDRETLAAEAQRLSSALAAGETASPRRVWLFSGGNRVADDILLPEMSRRFSRPEVLNLHGAFFSSVKEYRSASTN